MNGSKDYTLFVLNSGPRATDDDDAGTPADTLCEISKFKKNGETGILSGRDRGSYRGCRPNGRILMIFHDFCQPLISSGFVCRADHTIVTKDRR